MLVSLTEEQVNALRKLKEGMRFMDGYEPTPSDDSAVFAESDDGAFCEFAFEGEGRLTLGHLRDLASIQTPGEAETC